MSGKSMSRGLVPLPADASADLALLADSSADLALSAFRVAVRCRPLLAKERSQGESILTVVDCDS